MLPGSPSACYGSRRVAAFAPSFDWIREDCAPNCSAVWKLPFETLTDLESPGWWVNAADPLRVKDACLCCPYRLGFVCFFYGACVEPPKRRLGPCDELAETAGVKSGLLSCR